MKSATATMRSVRRHHDWVDERSRALHLAIAEKIRRDPTLLGVAKENLLRWMKNGSAAVQPAHHAWKNLIETKNLEELLSFLGENSERANEMRQSSPFAGVLTTKERDTIFAQYEAL